MLTRRDDSKKRKRLVGDVSALTSQHQAKILKRFLESFHWAGSGQESGLQAVPYDFSQSRDPGLVFHLASHASVA